MMCSCIVRSLQKLNKITVLMPSANQRSLGLISHRLICSSYITEAREKLKALGGGQITLSTNDESGIGIITIDNPSKKNAISGIMMTQLEEAVNLLGDWKVGKGLIINSTGDIFCSGSDISKLDESVSNNGMLISNYMHHILNRIFSLPLISLTVVNGKAIGGGAELTTTTDFRLFSRNAEIVFVHGKMGLTPGWGAGTRLVKILGPKLALELLSTSRKLTYDEALKMGYADHLLTEENKHLEAETWIKNYLKHHYTVLQGMKNIVVGARDFSFEESSLRERKIFASLWGGPVNLEALSKNIKHK